MGPDELDDLLASIRAESKPKNDSALKLYSGTRQDQLVTEIIDERILNLLGLQEVFDIDYATYISLLREKAGAARMGSRKFSTEEAELITNEFRRVKRKVGRFKLQKKKINAQNIAIRAPISSVSPKALMPTTGAAQPQQPIVQELIPPVTSIDNKLNELLSVLREDFKKEEKNEKLEAKKEQDESRKKREKAMEAKKTSPVLNALKSTAQRIVSPFQQIMDRIFKFIGFTLLGFGVDKIFKWFSNPENQKKIETIGKFLKDWWPTLLGAASLFFTPLGIFVKGIIGLLGRFTPALLRLARRNPLVAGGLLTAGVVTSIISLVTSGDEKGATNFLIQNNPQEIITNTTNTFSSGGIIQSIPTYSEGGSLLIPSSGNNFINKRNVALPSPIQAFSSGGRNKILPHFGSGMINGGSGIRIKGAGADTQLIAAKPGEIVIPTETVGKYGSNFFMNLIRSSGKSGMPTFTNNIQLAANGGMVGNVSLPASDTQSQEIPSSVKNYLVNLNQSQPMRRGFTNYINTGGIARSVKSYGSSAVPATIGKQPSVVAPVGTPVFSSETQMIVLPTKTTVNNKPDNPVKAGTEIPSFNPIASIGHRTKVTRALGISNLV